MNNIHYLFQLNVLDFKFLYIIHHHIYFYLFIVGSFSLYNQGNALSNHQFCFFLLSIGSRRYYNYNIIEILYLWNMLWQGSGTALVPNSVTTIL